MRKRRYISETADRLARIKAQDRKDKTPAGQHRLKLAEEYLEEMRREREDQTRIPSTSAAVTFNDRQIDSTK